MTISKGSSAVPKATHNEIINNFGFNVAREICDIKGIIAFELLFSLLLHCSFSTSLMHQILDISMDSKMPPRSVKEGSRLI